MTRSKKKDMATVTEAQKELAAKKLKRKVLRASFTKAEAEPIALADKAERLFRVDEEIQELQLSLGLEEEYEAEFERAEEYRQKFLKVQGERALQDASETNSHSPGGTSAKKSVKLPQLKLPTFAGQAEGWINFWAAFEVVHLDETLGESQKLQYLRQCVTGEAFTVVHSFPPSKENYNKVIDHLKQRFGRKDLLINIYVRDLISIVLTKNERSLANLYDNISTRLRALETLGLKSEEFGAIMCPLVESALPHDTIKLFERRENSKNTMTFSQQLEELMKFIQTEVEAEQRVKLALTQVENSEKDVKEKKVERVPTASTLHAVTSTSKCIFCDNKSKHLAKDCKVGMELSHEEKVKKVKESRHCFRCLEGVHLAKFCRMKDIKCSICSRRHYETMCREQVKKVNTLWVSGSQTILMQTLRVNLRYGTRVLQARALIDTGADQSYVSKACLKELRAQDCGNETILHSLFGGKESAVKHKKFLVQIESLDGEYKAPITVLDQEQICAAVPQLTDDELRLTLSRRGVKLSDEEPGDAEIKVLLGMDYIPMINTPKQIQLSENLLAVQTKLGWTVMGCVGSDIPDQMMKKTTLFVSTTKQKALADLWELDTLGIKDPVTKCTKRESDQHVYDEFQKTVKLQKDGRYSVKLPWQEGHPILQPNFECAKRRLAQTTALLRKRSKLDAYSIVIQDWLDRGIVEKVQDGGSMQGHYLPHLPVIRESSETFKVRPVFDASATDVRGNSLNSCLCTGPNLIEHIPDIINRFRWKQFGVTSDIKQAFLQIEVDEPDRDLLKFLWWENGEMVTLRHCRVVFGLASSPFLLEATINHHLDKVTGSDAETAQQLKSSFYVDNCVTSLDSHEKLSDFVQRAKTIMTRGKFELRGWRQSRQAPQHDEKDTIGLLGLLWHPQSDVIQINMSGMFNRKLTKLNKRGVLSCAQRLFDPIGVTSPVTLMPKLLLQELWRLQLSWDEPLPDEFAEKFGTWYHQCYDLEKFQIPRWVRLHFQDKLSLHIFSDASKSAYAACVFVRSEYKGQVSVQLLQARSRVAPLRVATIPRLELLGALIGVRLAQTVRKSLQLEHAQLYYWTDSKVALSWIRRDDDWNTFVGNRVKEIRSVTQVEEWRHVGGRINPADLPSRGCNGKDFLKSHWWEGPSWLKDDEDTWPKENDQNVAVPEADVEKRKIVLLKVSEELFTERLQKFEKFSRNVNSFAYILRFVNNCKKTAVKVRGPLQVQEVEKAREWLLNFIQKESFERDDVKLKGFHIFVEKNILRLKTRLTPKQSVDLFRCPIILDSKHTLVKRLILETHKENLHASVGMTLSILRKEFWILRGRQTVKKVLKTCALCWRHRARAARVPEGNLPEERIAATAPFETTGLDLAGPMMLKNGKKSWIVLYTCAVYRAIHLDLVLSLSSQALCSSMRRFIAIRGRPTLVYADCGTNIAGIANALEAVDWSQALDSLKIKWKFIPPQASWWGGFWERMVGLTKNLLRKVLGTSTLTEDDLVTIIYECAAVINNRPLSYLSEDPEDLEPLTPNSFIQPLRDNYTGDLHIIDDSLTKRAKFLTEVMDTFFERFQREYVAFLRNRQEIQKEDIILKGDLVLLEGRAKSKALWPLGRVLEVFTSADGYQRVARIKTKTGEVVRPFQKIYPLELQADYIEGTNTVCQDIPVASHPDQTEDEWEPEVVPPEKRTRVGRLIRQPHKLNLLAVGVWKKGNWKV